MKTIKYILSFILLNTYGISLASSLAPMSSELGLEEMLASVPHLALFIKTAILPTMTQNTLEWSRDGHTFRINFDFKDNEPRIIQQGSNYCLDWPKSFNPDELSDYINRLFLTMRLSHNVTNHQIILQKSVNPPEYLNIYTDIAPSSRVKTLITGMIKVFKLTQELPTRTHHQDLYASLRSHRHKKILLAKLFNYSSDLYQLVIDYNIKLDESGRLENKSLAYKISELFNSPNGGLPNSVKQKSLFVSLAHNRFNITFLTELQNLNPAAYKAVLEGNIAIENSI
jgi:hypothetical protein